MPRIRSLTLVIVAGIVGCAPRATPPAQVVEITPAEGILLDQSAGEQLFLGRERAPTLIKVDSATAGAREMFAMLRVLDPGSSLGRHRHRDDELIFIHTGDVTVKLGGADKPARAGATIFIPGNAWMDVRNTGKTPATLLIVFAAPHMSAYIRSLGTRPGEPKRDLTPDVLGPLAARHGITFAPAAAPSGLARLQAALAPHYQVFRPEGPGPFPTVLFISGCSGFAHPRAPLHYDRIAERFRSQGRAVVFADYVRAHGVAEACRGVLSPNDVGDYVLASIAHLRTQPFIDSSRLDVIGWSLGGGGVIAALAASEEGELQIRRAVALYPDCTRVEPRVVSIPTLVVLAGRDIVQPPAHCFWAVAQAAFPSARVVVRKYPHAHHGFDMEGLPTKPEAGLPALAYDEAAATAAWTEISKFLELPTPPR